MKLVKILARKLDEWPEADSEYGQIESMSQAGDYRVSHYAGVRQKWRKDLDDWGGSVGDGYVPCSRFTLSELATDHATAIVTRADWEAERAKLKAPKANGDGWIRHRGGKCPVEAGARVDYRMRNGRIGFNERAELLDWGRDKEIPRADIMAYRIHKPAEQLVRSGIVDQLQEQCAGLVESAESLKEAGPLEWRDRIRELDTQRAEVEATYQRQISEIAQERESLVQKLAGEGFSLIGDKPGALLTWQRYAKDGMKINAIKEYRELTGAGLRKAKETVEAYQDSLD